MTMKAETNKRTFADALAKCQAIADKKSTMPILGNVLIEAKDGKIRLAATDLVLAIDGSVPAKVLEAGSVCAPARDLLERIRMMPDGDVGLEYKDGALAITAAGSKRRYALMAFAGEEFPSVPGDPKEWIEVSAADLDGLISHTAFSVSTDDTRLHLSSALFEVKDGTLRMVSTDGHRMSRMDVAADVQGNISILIPRKGVTELRKLLTDQGSVRLGMSEKRSHLFADFGSFQFSVKLVDAQFPPYEQVIPKHEDFLTVPRGALAAAVKAVAISASDRTGGVKLVVAGSKMKIETESPEDGSAEDEIQVTRDKDAKHEVGVNARYLLDILNATDLEHSTIGFGLDALDPVLITEHTEKTKFTAVLMPMRL